ncbi:hypothetical protein ABZ876_11930 [Streptomyces sp. NPDC046931]|uniref:hypothetical protein n=1 Tax=Streptomyces sp. NPDC046931 TaxID=3154806 RepID=UPI0033F52A97
MKPLGIPSPLFVAALSSVRDDTFRGVMGVFHGLVGRPRMRGLRDWNMCVWHPSEFHNGPARVLWQWKVNQLLSEAGIE